METQVLEQKLIDLSADLKAFVARQDEQLKATGNQTAETKTAVENIRGEITKLHTQLDAIDAGAKLKHVSGAPMVKTIGQMVVEHEDFQHAKKVNFAGKNPMRAINLESSAFPMAMASLAELQQKANYTDAGAGSGTSGILMPTFIGGPLMIARQALRLRNILPARKLTEGIGFYYVQQSTRTNLASPQVEAAAKSESQYAWNTVSDTVKTIAHFTNVSRQALDDISWIRNTIDGELMYGLLLKEEAEILAGSGTGQDLNGLITQATAYDTATYNVTGDTKLDKLRHAKLQARLAGLATFAPSAFVVHPTDMHAIELLKVAAGGANTGNYIVGDPKLGTPIKSLWDLPVVESDSISAGHFLVGAFDTGAEIIDRMNATIDISYEHANNFTQNLATILCEERVGLAVMRPTAFIYGSY